jgi:hypothetical protein
MSAFEVADDVAVLVVEVVEGGVIEGLHPCTLVEDDADGRIFKQETRLVCQKDGHILVDGDDFLASSAEGFDGFNQKVEQAGMAHEAIDFIDGNHARCIGYKAVSADGGQHLCVGDCQQFRVATHLMEAENARFACARK